MNRKTLRGAVLLAPLVLLLGCTAQQKAPDSSAQGPDGKGGGMSAMPAAGDVAPGTAMIACPVSGHEVPRDKAYTIDYEGKKVAFCCADCEEPFRAEPAKYMAAVEKQHGAEAGHAGDGHEGH